jgi:3'-5' exoribonuclease
LKIFFSDDQIINKFKKLPAGKSVHHAYINGLLEHTLSVMKLVDKIKENYSDKVDEELLILGALFHDIGKIFELDIIKGFDYTDSGKLMGHLILGVNLIEKYVERIKNFDQQKKIILQHMILSHHGLLEFGAVKKPKTIEALILYHADDLDSKINTFESIFEKEEIENGWSSYDRLLERQIFKHF